MARVRLNFGMTLLVVGIAGAVVSSLRVEELPMNSGMPLNVCAPGERLTRPAASDARSPGEAMRMFCIDAQGARRDVTGDYIVAMADHMPRMADRVMPIILEFAFGLLAACGLLLVLLGLRARSRATAQPAPHVQLTGDLADRLRQVAEARTANLITQAEHDRLRDEILRATATAPRA
jgi:hypothetical protein